MGGGSTRFEKGTRGEPYTICGDDICGGGGGAGFDGSHPVPASISYVPQARGELAHGLRARLDLRVCRRLVQPSCSYQGSTPSTALEAVRSYGRSLGRVLIVNVGYNESADGYRQGVDRIVRAALAEGAVGVVWVTLREARSTYRWTNIAIRTAAKRWPQMVVADWNAYSRGKPWFSGDGSISPRRGQTR